MKAKDEVRKQRATVDCLRADKTRLIDEIEEMKAIQTEQCEKARERIEQHSKEINACNSFIHEQSLVLDRYNDENEKIFAVKREELHEIKQVQHMWDAKLATIKDENEQLDVDGPKRLEELRIKLAHIKQITHELEMDRPRLEADLQHLRILTGIKE